MGSLTLCLREAGELIAQETKDAIIKRASELRAGGAKPEDAARQAVDEMAGARQSKLTEVEQAATEGRTLYEDAPPPATPAAKAEAEAMPTRLQLLEQQHPDLMVQMDDMDAPMRLADFMATVKAEADEMALDAPLFEAAAQCAMTFGN